MMRATSLARALAVAALLSPLAGQAQFFSDDEARRAILELRQRMEVQRQFDERLQGDLQRATEENAQLRRSILELNTQLDALRGELARLRGTDEQLTRDVSDLQRRQKDVAVAVEERLRRIEPITVNVDGREFVADPNEQREFEAALAVFRRSDFAASQNAFTEFLRRHPQSGYRPSALFWLGNAQYANRDYRGALGSFRTLIQTAPDHSRAPEAVLSIANCQIELKENAAARRTLEDLVKAYPQSEAALAARERLARLR
ncbi:tol-pal system protein YbgF [Ramlibacter henchirensis]